jgi:poly(3-hydroxyalkanoate) synthetase
VSAELERLKDGHVVGGGVRVQEALRQKRVWVVEVVGLAVGGVLVYCYVGLHNYGQQITSFLVLAFKVR